MTIRRSRSGIIRRRRVLGESLHRHVTFRSLIHGERNFVFKAFKSLGVWIYSCPSLFIWIGVRRRGYSFSFSVERGIICVCDSG